MMLHLRFNSYFNFFPLSIIIQNIEQLFTIPSISFTYSELVKYFYKIFSGNSYITTVIFKVFESVAERPHLYSSVPKKLCYCPQYVNFLYLLIFWLTDQSRNVMTRSVTISVPAEQASVSHLYRCNSNSIHNTAVYVCADTTFNCSFSWKCLL